MKMEILIFDWSGTISDDRRPVYEANMLILERHQKSRLSFDGWLSHSAMTAHDFLEQMGIPGSPAELNDLYMDSFSKIESSGVSPFIYPDARDVLLSLLDANYRIAILSSHPKRFLHEEVKHYNLNSVFEAVRGGSTNKVTSLTELCNEINVSPSDAMYIGDTIFDIRSSKAAGLCSAGICTGYHQKEILTLENPDHLFDTLTHLKETLLAYD